METEKSPATNGSSGAPVETDEIRTSFCVEIPNPIVEPATQIEPENQMSVESDDDLIITTPDTVEIKREQQQLSLGWAKNCEPNVVIDLMDDENTIIMKTEINNENLDPNRANAMKRPRKRNVMTKKPQKPIVERCVGRIGVPKKLSRLNDRTIGSRQMNDDAINEAATSAANETLSDSEDDSVVSIEDQESDNEPGIIDATDMVAFPLQDPIADVEVPTYRQPVVKSIPNDSFCQLCNSQHKHKKALQLHYITKKHTSKVYELARNAAINASGIVSLGTDIQRPVQAARSVRVASSLYCEVCDFKYSSKKTMAKHLRSKKHTKKLIKTDPFELD